MLASPTKVGQSSPILILLLASWLILQPSSAWQLIFNDNNEQLETQSDENNKINSDYLGQSDFSSNPNGYGSILGQVLSGEPSNNIVEDFSTAEDANLAQPLLSLASLHEDIYILEDKDYPTSLYESYSGVGQVSGISTLPSGDVAIFHRASRVWDTNTFNESNNTLTDSMAQDNLIKNDTIMIIERFNGSAIKTFGSNLFYMPHGIASDEQGNLWVSDVGRHQVMRLPTSQLQMGPDERWFPGNLSRIWPDIILGEAFVPGSDEAHFCQPAEIEVSADGRLVFVADGYCNSRIVVFTGSGKFLTTFGETFGMKVVHSLTLIEPRNLLCVGDRENGRILCFRAGLDGDLSSLGEHVLSLDYPLGKVYAIESLSNNHMLVSSRQFDSHRYDMAALNPFTKELKQTWTSSDLSEPHALTKTRDGQYVYVADMSKDAYKKIFKFNVILRNI